MQALVDAKLENLFDWQRRSLAGKTCVTPNRSKTRTSNTTGQENTLSTPTVFISYSHKDEEWKDRVFRRQRIPRKSTVREYVGSQRRYAHLSDADIQSMEGYVDELDGMLANLEAGYSG